MSDERATEPAAEHDPAPSERAPDEPREIQLSREWRGINFVGPVDVSPELLLEPDGGFPPADTPPVTPPPPPEPSSDSE